MFSINATTKPKPWSVLLHGWYQICKNIRSAGFERSPQKFHKRNVIFSPIRNWIKLQVGLDCWSKYRGGCINSQFKQPPSPKCFIQLRIYSIFNWALILLTDLFVSFGDNKSSPHSMITYLLSAMKKYLHLLVFCFTEGYKMVYCVSIRCDRYSLKKPTKNIHLCFSYIGGNGNL